MTGAYNLRDLHDLESEPPLQTELNMEVKLDPPYNGLFFCFQRQNFFRWPEYISYYRNASNLAQGIRT